jgi:hypothetical protein
LKKSHFIGAHSRTSVSSSAQDSKLQSGKIHEAGSALLWEKKLNLQSHLPVRPEIRLFNIIVGGGRNVHRLIADPENLADPATEGDRPSVVTVVSG